MRRPHLTWPHQTDAQIWWPQVFLAHAQPQGQPIQEAGAAGRRMRPFIVIVEMREAGILLVSSALGC